MMYMVTAKRHYYDFEGVEVAGVFDTEEKANEAKDKVEQWMKEEGYGNSIVYICPCEMNWLKWYNLEEQIR